MIIINILYPHCSTPWLTWLCQTTAGQSLDSWKHKQTFVSSSFWILDNWCCYLKKRETGGGGGSWSAPGGGRGGSRPPLPKSEAPPGAEEGVEEGQQVLNIPFHTSCGCWLRSYATGCAPGVQHPSQLGEPWFALLCLWEVWLCYQGQDSAQQAKYSTDPG